MKKIVLLILSMALCLTAATTALAADVVPITPDYSWYNATDTTLSISSVEQLAALGKITQGNVKLDDRTITKDNFAGKTINLTQSISFADNQYWYYKDGVAANLVNYCIQGFAGIFNGNGYTIAGLNIACTQKNTNGMGLFSAISGSVNGLTLDNVTASFADANQFGLLSANLTGTATNCLVNDVTLSVARRVYGSGMMFGYVSGTASVTKCRVTNVTGNWSQDDNTDQMGTLIGRAGGTDSNNVVTISECSVENITYNCTQKTKQFGGLVGRTYNANVTDCTVKNVTISINNYPQEVGGFVGIATSNSSFTNCEVIDYTLTSNSINYPGMLGGFVGETDGSPVTFNKCTVTGLTMNVESTENRYNWGTGGFLGWHGGTVSLDECSVSGEISLTDDSKGNSAGALIGTSKGTKLNVNDSTANVVVTADLTAGGLVGKVSNQNPITFTDCKTTGSVTSNNGAAGGMVGYAVSGANITFNGDCVPSQNVTGDISNDVANSQDQEYKLGSDGTIDSEASVCSGTVGIYIIGYSSIKDALDAGATAITLLANVNESFSLDRDLTLDLGAFTLKGTISVPDGTFTVPPDHDEDKNPNDIHGITVTIKGSSSESAIILAEPSLDHHAFLGWCSSATGTSNSEDLEVSGGWQAVPGKETGITYHTHWKHSSYEHLSPQALHLTFTINYGDTVFTTQEVKLIPADDGEKHWITAIEDSEHFISSPDGLVAKVTPKADVVSKLDVNELGYEDIIHVTLEDGSIHSIKATLIVKPVGSVTAPATDTIYAEYGDDITLTVNVQRAPQQQTKAGRAVDVDHVVFSYNGVPLDDPAPVTYTDATKTVGTATLVYNTGSKVLPLGPSVITAEYGGSGNLLASNGQLNVHLIQRTLTISDLHAADRDFNGSKVIDVTGSMLDNTVPGDDVSIDALTGHTDDPNVGVQKPVRLSVSLKGADSGWYKLVPPTTLTVTIRPITIPAGTSVVVNGATVTGPATMNADGTVSVTTGGSITIGGETYVVASGPVTLNNDGTVTIPAGSAVIVDHQTISGPAMIDALGQLHRAATVPQTGDNAPIALWGAMLLLSAMGLLGSLRKRRA